MARSWRRRVVVFVLTATIVGVVGVSPALATWTPGAPSSEGVAPTVVADGRCSKVGSAGEHQLKIAKLYQVGIKEYSGPGGATITITSDGKTFSWQISSGFVVNDVTALGLLTPFNHYDYATPRTSDGNLHAPLLANKLRTLGFGYFCYSAVEVETETFSISGRKVDDRNANGDDEEEPGLGGWTIRLFQGDSQVGETTTGEGGIYWFNELEAGDYEVCEVLKPGWAQTSPGGCHSVTVGGEGGDASFDFLNVQGVDLCDEEEASASGGGTTGTFELVSPCGAGEVKIVDVSVEEDIVTLRPLLSTTEGTIAFTGTLIFVKALANPIPPLLYDQDLVGDIIDEVPVCDGEGEPPEGDTWCVTGVTVSTEGGLITVTWSVFGRDDPRFK